MNNENEEFKSVLVREGDEEKSNYGVPFVKDVA